jgi:hypothetical protein
LCGHALAPAAYSLRAAAMDANPRRESDMLKTHWKKLLIGAMVLVPGLAFAGLEVAERCFGWCPFCH